MEIAASLRSAVGVLQSGDAAEAERLFRAVIAHSPRHAPAYQGLGKALYDQLRIDEAESVFAQAIALDDVPALAHYHQGMCRLLLGDYDRGWKGWEKRLDVPVFGHPRPGLPRWAGSAMPGSRLLVLAEQGYGDTIQFSRFLPRSVEAHGGSVTFLCPKPLLTLYPAELGQGRITIVDSVRAERFDAFVSIGSLASIQSVRVVDLPVALPALNVDPRKVVRWRQERPAARIAVGLCWAGRPTHPQDRARSVPPEALLALRKQDEIALVGLQRPPSGRAPPAALLDADWGGYISDFSDLAAMIVALDAVVTVDTAIAHLAGSLGRPTHVLLPYAPDWRWMLGRNDSPWYPAVRLFRQPRPGDWRSVTAAIATALI